jgi:hypothetical protein
VIFRRNQHTAWQTHRSDAAAVSHRQRFFFWHMSALFLAIAAASCSDNVDSEAGADDVGFNTGDARAQNLCGGTVVFLEPPGTACGRCLSGTLECDGADALVCANETSANACGGCGVLSGAPDEPCGCDGVWQCDGTEAVVCSDTRERNLCGGCTPLSESQPGFACADGAGAWACDTAESTRCVLGATNACGGTGTILYDDPSLSTVVPGQACGICGLGTVICDPDRENTLLCSGGNRGVNRCGGCAALPASPGDTCGCGGTWTCDPTNADFLVCQGGGPLNPCGGCEPLLPAPGDVCNESGVLVCAGPNATRCAAPGTGICGESPADDPLPDPGTQCGPCGNGTLVCASDGGRDCRNASALNACNGCQLLQALPFEECADGRAWQCTDSGALECRDRLDRNRCGGAGSLDGVPGEPCGTCGQGTWACISLNQVACLGENVAPENDCGGCGRLEGVPGQPCGTCLTGVWECDGPLAVACVGEIPDAEFLLYFDRDEDGFGDPNTGTFLCPNTPGWVRDRRDCNDADRDANPDADEVCDGRDNDCDAQIDDGYVQYEDQDGDGWGNAAVAAPQCDPGIAGWTDRPGDCDDSDNDAFPRQSAEFSRPRADGTFDYNCDGRNSRNWPEPGRCGVYPYCAGFDTLALDYRVGFVGTVPDCGERGTFLYDCRVGDRVCIAETREEVQECR